MKRIILAVALVVLGGGVCFGRDWQPDTSWKQKLRASDDHKPETILKVLGEKRHKDMERMKKNNNKVLNKKGKPRQPQKGSQEKPRRDHPRHDSPEGRDASQRPF